MSIDVLVAGIGNVFFADDGFGCAVASRLADDGMPHEVEVGDFGIRGVHLAYQLLDGYELVVLIDVMHGDGPPGTVYVVDHVADGAGDVEPVDAHGMSPDAVLALVPALGGSLPRVVVVGCEPSTTDAGMGLTEVVEAAVEPAAAAVRRIVADRSVQPARDTEVTV